MNTNHCGQDGIEELRNFIAERDGVIARLGAEVSELRRQLDLVTGALERSLNWLSSYPGGCAAGCYEQARAALAAVRKPADSQNADSRSGSAAGRCQHCDDTGEVNSPVGEWRGLCSCPAGEALKRNPEDCVHALSVNDDMELLCCAGFTRKSCDGPCDRFSSAFPGSPAGEGGEQ